MSVCVASLTSEFIVHTNDSRAKWLNSTAVPPQHRTRGGGLLIDLALCRRRPGSFQDDERGRDVGELHAAFRGPFRGCPSRHRLPFQLGL
jgi:hypothetical protein